MTLGIAVFILGCMYFYFKEDGFRKAVQVLGVLVLLAGFITVASYLIWR